MDDRECEITFATWLRFLSDLKRYTTVARPFIFPCHVLIRTFLPVFLGDRPHLMNISSCVSCLKGGRGKEKRREKDLRIIPEKCDYS